MIPEGNPKAVKPRSKGTADGAKAPIIYDRAAEIAKTVTCKKCLHFSICACHPCAWGHANLLCNIPILTDDPRRESIEKGRFGRARFNAKALLFVGMAEDASAQFAMLRKPGRVLEHSCTSRRATTTPTPRKMAMPTGVQPPCHCR